MAATGSRAHLRSLGRGVPKAVAVVALAVAISSGLADAARTTTRACAKGEARSLELISARTGKLQRDFPGVSGAFVVAADGHGGWFVAGSISCLGGLQAASIVHLDRAGRLDRSWRPARGGAVAVLAVFGSTLYAGGAFGVEALDARTGTRRWLTRVRGGSNPGVLALAATSRLVFVGGGFTHVGATPKVALAALDPATGRLLPWKPPELRSEVPSPVVEALALDGTRLFIGGVLSRIGGQKRPGIAALDAASGRLTPWLPGTARGYVPGSGVGDVSTIVIAHDAVMTAGHDGFGVTSATTGAIQVWMNDVQGVGSHFAASGKTIYLAGDNRNGFTAVAGRPRHNLAAFDSATGTFTRWAPKLKTYLGVNSMAASSDAVLIAGSFSNSLG